MLQGESTLFWSRSKAMQKMHQPPEAILWILPQTEACGPCTSGLRRSRVLANPVAVRADARNHGDRRRCCTRSTLAAKQLSNSCGVTTVLRGEARSGRRLVYIIYSRRLAVPVASVRYRITYLPMSHFIPTDLCREAHACQRVWVIHSEQFTELLFHKFERIHYLPNIKNPSRVLSLKRRLSPRMS